MKLNPKTINYIGWSSIASLSLLTLICLVPISGLSTSATSTATTDIDAVVEPFISLSASPNITIDAKGTETITSSIANVSVSTNSREGYSLYLSVTGKDNSLHSSSQDNLSVISPVAANSTAATFSNNSWGYNLTEAGSTNVDTYNPVPMGLDITTPVTTTNINSIKTYDLTFATKVDATLPADTYSNSVLISAIANPITATSLNELNYMQSMTPEICNNTADYEDLEHYVERRLIDIRDGKSYYVAKLADGNCWMTQNLDLDLSTKKTLTSSDTDLNSVSSWTPEHDTSRQVPEKVDNPSYTEDLSWDLGDYVLATPQRGISCQSPNSTDQYNSVLPGETLAQCTDFQNVKGWTPGEITATEWNGYTGLIAADEASKTYNPHYLIGNYYQWNAAVANSWRRTENGNTDAVDSICPKGWKLPVAGRNTAADAGWPLDREDSFYQLLRAYGYPETGSSTTDTSLASTKWITDNGNSYTNITGQGKIRLDGAPTYFTRSSTINLSSGALVNAGSDGYSWSSTIRSASSQSSFGFGFASIRLYPSNSYSYYSGFPLRCLAR